jgi:hypothetical protein
MKQQSMEHAPTIQWTAPPTDEYRTLICFDPDSTAKSWVHWLSVNCTGGDATSGDEILTWTPPSPPSGVHRYIFTLYAHQYPIDINDSMERGYFDVAAFINKWGLKQIGFAQTTVSSQEQQGAAKKKDQCTLVTAYFNVSSRRDTSVYMEWAENLLKLEAPIVMFTTPDYYEKFIKIRGNLPIKIHTVDFNDMYMWKTYRDKWNEHYLIDPEAHCHSSELFAIWANKSVWLKDVANENPFSTDYFMWCDFGAFRDSSLMHNFIKTFPSCTQRFNEGKILFSIVYKFQPDDFVVKNDIPGNFTLNNGDYKDRITGGLWGGDKLACNRWNTAYEDMLQKYFNAGLFAGKEQSVMMSTMLDDLSLVELVEPPEEYKDTADRRWFFLQYFLSRPEVIRRVYVPCV